MPDNNFPPGGIADQLIKNGGFILPKPSDYTGVQNPVNPVDYFNNMMDSVSSAPSKREGINRVTPISPFQIDTSGKYPKQLVGADNEDLYAQGQHWYTKLGNDTLKMLGLAGTTFIQGTVGLVNGVRQWISDGRFASLYDNDLNRALDQFNQKLENQLPNYYTARERDAKWYEPSNLLTANFLFDKVLKNLGFSLGAAASGFAWGAALKGIGLTGALARTGEGLLDAAKATDTALEAIPQAERTSTFLNTLKATAAKYGASTAGNILSKSDRILTAAFGTVGEASMEALNNLNEFRNNLVSEYEKQNGYKPTGQDLEKINQMAEGVGNWSFGLNVALLTGTNYIQFPKILNSSYKAEKALVNDIETQPLTQTAEGIVESVLPKAGFAKRLYQAKNIAGLLFNPTEGFEEGAQYTIQEGTEDYYNKAYHGKDNSFLSSLSQGIHQTLHTKEGIENILIGGFSGALQTSGIIPYHLVPGVNQVFGGESQIRERGFTGYGGERAEATQHAIEALNKAKFGDYLKDSADTQNRGAILQSQREAAIRQGDILESKDLEHDFAHNYLANRIKYGRFDFIQQDIDQYRQLAATQEGFEQLQRDGYAAPTDTQASFIQRLNNFQKHANNVKKLYDALNLKYAGLGTRDKEGNFQRTYPQEVIDKMVYAASKVKDYDRRIQQLAESLLSNNITVQPAINEITSTSIIDTQNLKNAINEVNNLPLLGDEKDELLRNLRDIAEISLRRKQFYNEYEDIRKNPENWYTRTDDQGNRVNKYGKKKRTTVPSAEPYDVQARRKFKGDRRTYDDLVRQYGEGEINQREALRKVMESPYATTRERNLAAKFLEFSSKDDIVKLGDRSLDANGIYNSATNMAHVNYEGSAEDYEGGNQPFEFVFLHELGHKYTVNGLESDGQFKEDIGKLYDVAKEFYDSNRTDINSKKKDTLPYYAFKKYGSENDYKEFVTEALSSQKFQEFLSQIPYKNTQRSSWDKFIDNLKKFFSRLLGIKEDSSLLDEIVGTVTNQVDRNYKNFKEEIEEEEAELEKAKEEIVKLEKQLKDQQKAQGNTTTPSPEENTEYPDDPKKRIERVFAADIHNPNKENEFNKRHQKFLQVADTLPYRDNLQQLIVTANNEDALGLTGLTAAFTRGSEYEGKEKDPLEGPIVKVMVVNEKGEHYFVDTEGKKIKGPNGRYIQVGKQVSIEQIVASVAPKATLNWSKEFGEQQNFSHASEEEAELWRKAWEEKRKEIFNWTGENYFPFNISRGTGAVREQENNQSKRNPVVGSLLPEGSENLLNTVQNLVQVSTGTTHQFNGENINVQPGRPFFAYKSSFDFLNNRYLNKQEAETVFAVLKQITQEIKDSKGLNAKLRDFLNGIIYFAKPTNQDGEAKPLLQNNIFFDGPAWVFGKKSDTEAALQIPFTVDALEASKDQIISTIQGMFNNVNNHKLTQLKGQAYDEYFLDKDGNLQTRTWPNYQSYLIAAKNPDGSERDIPLTTNLAPQAKSPEGRNYKYKYTWNPDLLQEPDMSSLQQRLKQEEIKTSDENKQTKKIGNIRLSQTVNEYGAIEREFFNEKEGIGFFQLITPAGESIVTKMGNIPKMQMSDEKFQEAVLEGKKISDFTFSREEQKQIEQPKQIAHTSKKEPISYSIQGDDLEIFKDESYQNVLKRLMDAGNSQEDSENAIQQTVINHIIAGRDNVKENLQPKQEVVKDSLQDKKADIERRRQEELNKTAYNHFPNSKVKGIVYHGTTRDFDRFDKNAIKNFNFSDGIFFSPRKDIAEDYAYGEKGRIVAAVINVKDPNYAVKNIDKITEKEKESHDSAIEGNYIAVFEPEQIRILTIKEVEEIEKINAKYDAELTALEKNNKFTLPQNDQVSDQVPDDDVFSTIRNWEYIKGNMEKEKSWIAKHLPIPTHIVENIIKKTDGGYAFGKLRDKVITLWEGAQQGTGYHEAFEAVWNLFTEPKEREAHLKDFRRRQGTFTDDNGNTVEYKNATDQQAKEEMAEEFRHYVLNKQPKKQGLIARFIQWLHNTLKDLFFSPKSPLEELFKKIDSGYFKSVSPLNNSKENQYSTIPGLDTASTQRVVQGIATKIFQQFAKAAKEGKRSFTEFDLGEEVSVKEFFDNTFNSIYKDLDSQGATYTGVKNAIELGRKALEKQTTEYLRTLHLSIPDNEEDRENEEASFSRDESYLKDTFEWTGGRNAAASIRLLISTIIDTEVENETGKLKPKRDDSTFMVKMVDSSKLWNQLYTELSPFNTPLEKEQKVLELAKQFPSIQVLAQRLGLEKEAPTDDDFELRAKFFHTFSKQKPVALVQVKEDGNVFIKEMNQGDAIRRLTTDWLDREKWQQDSGLVEWQPNQNGEGGIWALNQKKIESILPGEIRNLSSQLKVLSILGIPSTKELWENLSGKDKEKFNNYVASIYSILKSKEVKNAATPASLKLETPIRGLAQLYVKTSGEYPESTFVGLTGERRAEFIQGNTISVWINDINNSQSLDELKEILPHLNQLWAKNSQYLSQDRLDAARNEKSPLFEVEYVQGTDNRDDDNKVETEKLTEGNRLLQEINLNLGGHFYTVLPADAKTEYTIKTTPVFGMQDMQSTEFLNRLQSIFNSYYEVEKQLYKEDGKERLLKPIVGDYSAKTISKEKIENWLKDLVQQQKQFLQDQKIVNEYDKDSQTLFSFEGLNTDFTNKNNLNSNTLSKEDLNNILTLRTVNYAINNIEMMKLFFGDPVAYWDEKKKGFTDNLLKRIKSFLSPREISVYDWDDFNSWANQHYNEGLQQEDFGYYTHKDYADTITLGTVNSYTDSIADDEYLPEEISVPYKKSDSTDGQGDATLPGYREMRIKRGHTWTLHDQALYEYLMARDRQLMYEDGKLTDDTYRKELQERDKKTVEKGPDTKGQLYVLKPVGSGYTLTDDPFLDKYSLFPLTYAAVRKTALGDHYIEMVRRGMAYAIFDSGRKVGQGPIQEFYDENGNAKTDYTNIVQIPYRYLGIQTETAGSKDSQTTGSQVSKYVTTNIYDGGVPSDYKGDLLSWIKLSEEERKKASPRHTLAEHNREVREQMVEEGYQRLLRKLGIEQESHTFEVDKEVVQKLLQNELLRRELPNNIRDALQVENGEWKVPLEALNNYREIKNIIYSYVQKFISKPKVNGAPAVQVSSGGMASLGVKKDIINGKQAWVSSNLKFYKAEYNDGKVAKVNRMQVYMSVPDKLIKLFPGKTAEEIFDLLKSSKEGQDILSAIGFRIPTQEMNSIDAFEIAGFLPIGYVNTVVVPEALTTKAGSDFDVDKLNTYLKNIWVDEDNNVGLIPYFKTKEEAQDWLLKNKSYNSHINTTAQNLLEDEDAADKEFDKFETDADGLYWKGLENEYFRSMEALILHPDNYERLIRPNNADKSKEIADSLQRLAPKEFGSSVSSIMNPRDMSHMRHLFLLAKQWVGMVAVHATGHTLTQKFPIILNPERFEHLTQDEKDAVKNLNIALPHKTITLQDGNSYATISNGRSYTGTDRQGEYISDVISRRLDGTVDAVKSPWLSVIIQNTNMVGLHMLLDRLSVPEEISSYFLNQPIIRRFNQLMDQRAEGEYESDVINQLETEFPVDNKEGGKTIITKFPTQDVSKLSKHLQDNISRYYTDPESISHQDNAEQRFVFDEFKKYRVLARHLQKFNAATSYDTASFTDMNMAEFKERQTRDVEQNNLFTSVEDILNKTFIGKVRDRILDANQAISSSLFRFDTPQVRKYLMPVLNQIGQYTFGADNYLSAARKVEQSFIQYLIQNSGLNLRLKELLVDPKTNIATKLANLKLKGDIVDNPVIKALKIQGTASDTATKNVQLFSKAYDVFTSNIYTAALLELKYNEHTAGFYRDLIDAAFLQAGISQQNNSFSDIIPNEDFREKLEQAISQLNNPDLMEAFSSTGAFYRNRWWDADSVPRATFKQKNVLTKQVWKPVEVPFLYKVNSKSRVSSAPYITISTIRKEFQDERDDNNRVIKSLKNIRKQMAKRGDFSYKQTVLLQRVRDSDGDPISTPGFMGTKDMYYAPVHAYGDAQKAQEYYSDTEKSSVLNNNVYNPGKEYSVEKIAQAFYKWKGQKQPSKEEQILEQTKDVSKKLEFKKGPCK